MTPATLDVINAVFELVGSIVVWLNFVRLRRDRSIKGVDWRVTVFYSAWGVWNLPYYYGVGSLLSCAACLGICTANVAWCVRARRSDQKSATGLGQR